MSKPLLFTLNLVVFFRQAALAQDTTYYNASWKETTADSASYFRLKIKKDIVWHVRDCFKTGKTQMAGSYSDDSCHIKQGEFTWYDDKGNLYHRCMYIQGNAEGAETLYFNNGHKRTEGMNKAGNPEGEWVGYYPSGKLSAKARFRGGKQVAGSFFQEDGKANPEVTLFSRDANYPGGPPAFLHFLGRTMRYPDTAVNREIQGTVMVGFNISADGKATDIKVLQSVDKFLDAEAVRVIRLMADWEPLIIGGIPCDSYHKQPIIFKLQD
jgi:TonB family protein